MARLAAVDLRRDSYLIKFFCFCRACKQHKNCYNFNYSNPTILSTIRRMAGDKSTVIALREGLR